MFLRQAVRYRRWQACVLVGLSALVTASALFGPWFARAVEQSYTHATLTEMHDAAAWRLESEPSRGKPHLLGPGDPGYGKPARIRPAATPETLEARLPRESARWLESPVSGMSVRAYWSSVNGGVSGWLAWREDVCAQLVVVAGRCPTAAREVMVSTADRTNYHLAVGGTILVHGSDQPVERPMRVTGVYEPRDGDGPYWFMTPPVGRSIVTERGNVGDLLLTPRRTFDTDAWAHTSTVETAPVPGAVRVDYLPTVLEAGAALDARLTTTAQYDAKLTTALGDVNDRIRAGRRQVVTIVPLVMLQVALFGLVVMAFAAAAAVGQRRPELAVARLRGWSTGRVGRNLFRELAVLVLAGALAGAGLAWATMSCVRRWWLDGTAPAELPWTVPAAGGAALLAGLVAVLFAITPVVRRPIGAQLLSEPPARRRQRTMRPADLVLVTLAAAGVLAAVAGDDTSALAMVTPTLLGLAAGLTTARLITAVAEPSGRRALRRGRLGTGLLALQLARWRAPAQLVPAIVVGAALATFCGQVSAVADRNRDTRSKLEVGAASVLDLTSGRVVDVRPALDRIDPERIWSTPVVVSPQPSLDQLRTMGVELSSFRRIAFGADRLTFDRLHAPDHPAAIELGGDRISLAVDASGLRSASRAAVRLSLTYVDGRGLRHVSTVGAVLAGAQATLTSSLECRSGCRLLRIDLEPVPDRAPPAHGEVEVHSMRTEGRAVALGLASHWQSGPDDSAVRERVVVTVPRRADGLRLRVAGLGTELGVQHAWMPIRLPVLLSADTPPDPSMMTPGLDGRMLAVEPGPSAGPIPRHLHHTALTDIELLLRWAGPEPITLSKQLWLNAEGERHRAEIVAGLEQAGIRSRPVDRLSDHRQHSNSASALSLRLTPLAGAAAWILAVVILLLVIAATWRSRTHDHAGLQMAGVPSAVTSRANYRELLVVSLMSGLIGSACGVAGAQVALPLIPIFESPEPAIPIHLGISVSTALLSIAVTSVLLGAGALLSGIGLRRRTTFARLREQVG